MSSLPRSFGAAIDLSALKNPVSASEIPGVAINQSNLMQDVLPASHTQVVILLCWSPRSPQSLSVLNALGAMHDSDSKKAEGANWLLGGVNVDQEPEVAKALQVQAVPLALAIIQEQVVPLFETVPTPEQLELIVEKVLALAAERGIGGEVRSPEVPVAEKLEPEEVLALEALDAGNFVAARDAYQAWLNRAPGNSLAQLGLAQVELLLRIDGLDSTAIIEKADADPSDLVIAMHAADCEMAEGNYESSFNRLITAIAATKDENRKILREHLVGLFALVDPVDPILIRARQQLASALF